MAEGQSRNVLSEDKESRRKVRVTPLTLQVMEGCFEGGTVQTIVEACEGNDLTGDHPTKPTPLALLHGLLCLSVEQTMHSVLQ
jgi:hypothetical protein